MNRVPKIGQRVRYVPPPDSYYRTSCTGVVRKIYQEYEWDEERQCEGALLPQREWRVAVEVDAPLPGWWACVGTNLFCPPAKELRAKP